MSSSIIARIESSVINHDAIRTEGELAYRILLAEQHFDGNIETLNEEIKNLFSLYLKHLKCFTRSFVDRYSKYIKMIYNCKTYMDILTENAEKEVQEFSQKCFPTGYVLKSKENVESHIIYVDPNISSDPNVLYGNDSTTEKQLAMFKSLFCDCVVVPNSYFSFTKGWQEAESPYILESDWIDIKNKFPDIVDEFVKRGNLAYEKACQKVEHKKNRIMKSLQRTINGISQKKLSRIEIIEFGTVKIV